MKMKIFITEKIHLDYDATSLIFKAGGLFLNIFLHLITFLLCDHLNINYWS